MPINNILKEELIKAFQEHGQSEELIDQCIKILNAEHDNKIENNEIRREFIKKLIENIK